MVGRRNVGAGSMDRLKWMGSGFGRKIGAVFKIGAVISKHPEIMSMLAGK